MKRMHIRNSTHENMNRKPLSFPSLSPKKKACAMQHPPPLSHDALQHLHRHNTWARTVCGSGWGRTSNAPRK
eukprot:5079937-Prorocentrum_lima.AAC.1